MRWLPVRTRLPLGFVAIVEQNRSATGPVARFHIVENIPNHPRSRQVNTVFTGRLLQHTRLWLSARTRNRIRRNPAIGMMRTIVKTVEMNPKGSEQVLQAICYGFQGIFLKVTLSNTRLIGNNQQPKPRLL